MGYIITITILLVLLLLFILISINLFRKNEYLEKVNENQIESFKNISELINESDKKINEIDRLGAFKSDDEIGFFFNTVKNIQESLNEFRKVFF